MRLAKLTALTIMLGLSTQMAEAAGEWKIDGKHSSATFKVRHMMVSNVTGTISGVKGTVSFDENPKALQIDAELDPATINTNEPDRDKHLRNADFFDVEKYPTMSFKSTRVEKMGAGKYKIYGKLTMRGVTKDVTLTMDKPAPAIKDIKNNLERIGATASTKINRKDFGMTYNRELDQGGLALGDDIEINIDVEAHRQTTDKAATN